MKLGLLFPSDFAKFAQVLNFWVIKHLLIEKEQRQRDRSRVLLLESCNLLERSWIEQNWLWGRKPSVHKIADQWNTRIQLFNLFLRPFLWSLMKHSNQLIPRWSEFIWHETRSTAHLTNWLLYSRVLIFGNFHEQFVSSLMWTVSYCFPSFSAIGAWNIDYFITYLTSFQRKIVHQGHLSESVQRRHDVLCSWFKVLQRTQFLTTWMGDNVECKLKRTSVVFLWGLLDLGLDERENILQTLQRTSALLGFPSNFSDLH